MGKEKIYKIVEDWKRDMLVLLAKSHPNLTEQDAMVELKKILNMYLKDTPMVLDNNYTKNTYSSSLLELTEFIHNNKLTTGGNGVLFDRDGLNPATAMLDGKKKQRKAYKKEMYKFPKGSDGYINNDLLQSIVKRIMNSWYGISGSIFSLIYNLYCATATTAKGQSLIGVATLTFEAFLSDNVKFLDMNDCMIFIKNVLTEKRTFEDDEILDENIDSTYVYYRLRDNMEFEKDFDGPRVRSMLRNCSKVELNRLYYKSNLYEFCNTKYMKNKLHEIAFDIDSYNDPDLDAGEDILPLHFKTKLEGLWKLLEEYVFYNYEYTEKIYRIKTQKRKTVVVVDTDSNMLHLSPWLEFMKSDILTKAEYADRDMNCESINNILIFSLCYSLSSMMRSRLHRYLTNCNVKESEIGRLDMKSEFFYSRMCVTNSKKAYAAYTLYKEGNAIPPEEALDIKGLAIRKADTNRNASEVFKGILEHDMLLSPKIDVVGIVRKLTNFEEEITSSMTGLSKEYLKPAKCNEASKYADPYRQMQYMAYLTWNAAHPDKPIILPDNFNVIKIKLTKEDDLDNIPDDYIEIKDNIRENIFNNEEEVIRRKGGYVIAIPHDEEVPKWISYVMDLQAVVSDTMKAFAPLSECLGIVQVNDGDRQSPSSFISL